MKCINMPASMNGDVLCNEKKIDPGPAPGLIHVYYRRFQISSSLKLLGQSYHLYMYVRTLCNSHECLRDSSIFRTWCLLRRQNFGFNRNCLGPIKISGISLGVPI